MAMAQTARFSAMMPDLVAWRRDFHAHPELLFDVERTAALVAERLRAFGCDEVATGIGRSGVVGVIRGRSTLSGRVIGLRADMDALPIAEATGLPHASTYPGRMHACGHDGHTTMLLGAARHLAATRDFDGTAIVIFQPAEEGGGGGREMVQDGLMERWGIEQVFGLHNKPGLALGRFEIRPGPFLAAADRFTILVTGRGGHAALPHQAADPVVAASHIVLALQSVVARNVDPVASAVVTIGGIRSESEAFNVIPARVTLQGTVRTLDPEVQDLVEARLVGIAEATARAHGAIAEIDYVRNYPVTVNAPAETAFAASVAAEVAGPEAVDAAAPPIMGAEDFSFMLEARPGAFIFLGNGDSAPLHHPEYDFNDAAIAFGCEYWVRLVEAAMPAAPR
jgi:amidohydrolase